MKPPDTNRIILGGDAIYGEFSYRSEKELESLAVKNRDALFGKSSIYFDIKKLITSNASISKVPDGLLLTCTSLHDSKIWLVEYELSTHDLERHIYPQIPGIHQSFEERIYQETYKGNNVSSY